MTLHRRCGRRTVLPSQERRRVCLAQRRWSVMQQVSPSRGGADHRGGCGASRLNTARGTPWVWRTCGTLCLFVRTRAEGEAHRTSTSLEVARRRGPRVQLDPWRPARPRFFFRAMRIFPNTTAHPAPQRNRAAELCPPQPSAKAGCLTSESYLSGHSGARAISAFTRVFDALCERTRLRAEALSGEHKHPNLRRAKARNPEGNTARASGFRVRPAPPDVPE